jgi:hypothetical protein
MASSNKIQENIVQMKPPSCIVAKKSEDILHKRNLAKIPMANIPMEL